jgi:predicted regulator of Ras-like GTPase activity (Roadblock/LC7/MglB family)
MRIMMGGGGMFREILQDIVESTEGSTAGLLMGFDGIAIDQYSAGDGAFDVEAVGMEYSVLLKGVQQAAEMLDAGTASEIAVRTERLTTVVRLLNDEYFAAVTLQPDGNLGKARFLLRVKAPDILDNL